MKNILIAGFVLLVYQQGVIVSEKPYKTHQECVQAKHQLRQTAACTRAYKADTSRVQVPIEEIKVEGQL